MFRDAATLPMRPVLIALFVGLGLTVSACKAGPGSDIAGAVSNGHATPAGTYPGVGLLSLLDDTGKPVGYCTGVFVRDDLVMTVAHCFASVKFSRIKVATNSGALHNRNPTSITYMVNPKFDNTQTWTNKLPADVAFVQFAPGTAEQGIIARLGVIEPAVGTNVALVGFAVSKLNDPTSAGLRYIMQTKVNTVKQAAGNALLSAPILVAPINFNTISSPDLAPGGIVADSGGPLFNEAGEVVGMSVGSIDLDSGGNNLPAGTNGVAAGGAPASNAVSVPANNNPSVALDDAAPAPAAGTPKVFTFLNIRNANAAPYIAQQLNVPKLKAPTAQPGSNPSQGAGTFPNAAAPGVAPPVVAPVPGAAAPTQGPAPVAAPGASPTGTYTDPTSGQTFPICASTSSADSRYPGWGWENEKSCKIQ